MQNKDKIKIVKIKLQGNGQFIRKQNNNENK